MKATVEPKTTKKENAPEESAFDAEVNDEDDIVLRPSKPSHIEFGKYTMKLEDLCILKKVGYFGEKDNDMIRFVGDKTILEPKDDEIVVFMSFFWAGLWLSMFTMIAKVLKKYEIFMQQLTPNAIARLSIYIWAMHGQSVSASDEGFCRVHELHYQTKARPSDKLHNNFRCYIFCVPKGYKSSSARVSY